MEKRQVYYFEKAGKRNTEAVIEAVSQRLETGDIKQVIIASGSGETAVKFARSLKDRVDLICVSGPPYRREMGREWPCLKEEFRQELEKSGVVILDRAPHVFHNSVIESAPWAGDTPERIMQQTLYCFGQGMKVVVEIAIMGVLSGYVPPFSEVIAVGGTYYGADTAVVLRATYPGCIFHEDPAKRLRIREILAMPVSKKRQE